MSSTIACPDCGEMKSRTLDSRATSVGVRRRRLCKNNHGFTTYEITRNRLQAIKALISSLEEILY